MKKLKIFESDDNLSLEEIKAKLSKLHSEIEKHYGRKLESSQINTMMGDNEIYPKIEKYKNLSKKLD